MDLLVILEIIKMEKGVDMGSSTQMMVFTLDNGKIISKMDMEFIYLLLKNGMKEDLRMICLQDKDVIPVMVKFFMDPLK